MVDPSQPTQQSDTEMLAVPKELALLLREIIYLYYHHKKQDVIEAVKKMITAAKDDQDYLINQDLTSYSLNSELENDEDFRKSWDDIFNVQVYIDTEIFGELDPCPAAIVETNNNLDSETVIQHTEATEAYMQAWKELAQNMSSFPDDLFTRLWTTIEIANIVKCTPISLHRARRSGLLPIRINNLTLDCIARDGEQSLWFVRPA
ncbi:MAG: hypothetical protein ACKPCM_07885 [Pseudanabaena sp.]